MKGSPLYAKIKIDDRELCDYLATFAEKTFSKGGSHLILIMASPTHRLLTCCIIAYSFHHVYSFHVVQSTLSSSRPSLVQSSSSSLRIPQKTCLASSLPPRPTSKSNLSLGRSTKKSTSLKYLNYELYNDVAQPFQKTTGVTTKR